MGNSMNSGLFVAVAVTSALMEYVYLRWWYARRKLVDIVFFGSFANGATWALCWGVWGWFNRVIPENYTPLLYAVYVAVLGVVYGATGLVPAAVVALAYRWRKRSQ